MMEIHKYIAYQTSIVFFSLWIASLAVRNIMLCLVSFILLRLPRSVERCVVINETFMKFHVEDKRQEMNAKLVKN